MKKNTTQLVKKTKEQPAPELARLDLPVQQQGLEKYAADPDDVIGRAADSPATVVRIPIVAIVESTENARRVFDQAELEGLAQSMRAVGLREPVELKPRGAREDGAPGAYELVDGARRLRAAKLLAWDSIPAWIHDDNDLVTATVRAVRNNQRVNLTPYEEALDFKNILDKGATAEQVAQLVGRSADLVRQRLTLLELPGGVAARVGQDGVTLQHAATLLKLVEHPELFGRAVKMLDEKDYRGKTLGAEDFERKVAQELEKGQKARLINVQDYRWYDVAQTKKFRDAAGEMPKLKLAGQEVVIDAHGELTKLRSEHAVKKSERVTKTQAEKEEDARRLAKLQEDEAVRDELDARLPEILKKGAARVSGFDKRVLRVILDRLLGNLPYTPKGKEMLTTISGVPEKDIRALEHDEKKRAKFIDELLRKKTLDTAARVALGIVLARSADEHDLSDTAIEAIAGVKRADIEKKIRKELRSKPKTSTKASDAPEDVDVEPEEES